MCVTAINAVNKYEEKPEKSPTEISKDTKRIIKKARISSEKLCGTSQGQGWKESSERSNERNSE